MKLTNRIKTVHGIVEGVTAPHSGIRIFKGIPFAAPPVGDLRWKPPQPVENWEGVRKADQFGPRAMQLRMFGDMGFRSNGMSEDCLYLNVWTPAQSDEERLPVLVYFYGGGNMAGDGSEPRYDGESMACQGIVTLTMNYRLSVFGFLAHPELAKESLHHASGNYGYLDQTAALRWVQQNIAAFGGDPARVTIAGESAGSISVSVQMVSPLAKDLIAGAIGESGAAINPTLAPVSLAEAEQAGLAFATSAGASSLAELRAMPAEQLLQITDRPNFPFAVGTVDGYFLPQFPADIFAAGKQAHVPLLAGWNSAEMNHMMVLGQREPTPENYAEIVRARYGDLADQVLVLYPASTTEQTIESATDLASDNFIAYSTWKWCDLHGKTGDAPVYRYLYAHPRPPMKPEMDNVVPGLAGGVVDASDAAAITLPPARGAVHSAEIEYAMGNLATNKVYAWTPDDFKVSQVMQAYFANFIKTGDPNGPGLPVWPAANRGGGVQVMRLDVDSRAEPERHRARYLFLDQFYTQKPGG
ncbi:MAG: carboxylesterase family protein [Anaerolineae bacterium]|nr:carboxylesterase family protein [Anaerolineae bacterium]